MQKKSTHPGKKAQKVLQPIKKKQATEKSTIKHYSAFKSTHYDPCIIFEVCLIDKKNFTMVTTFSD